jgi:hypothetical protein
MNFFRSARQDLTFEGQTVTRTEQGQTKHKDTKIFNLVQPTCSGPWKPGSRCRLSKARGLLGKPKGGSGNPRGGREFGTGREWGGVEKEEVSLRATWDQGRQDRFTPKEGFQVSRGE